MYAAMPLINYVRDWLVTFKEGTVKPATFARLETSLTALQKYEISQIPIREITAFDIQQYVNRLTNDGYGRTTIKKQMEIVTAPLKQAAALHYIPADPSAGVRLPAQDRVKKQPRDTGAYTDAEQEALWRVIDASDDPAVIAIGMMIETGLRVGELLALRWSNLSIERKRLTVDGTILNISNAGKSKRQDSPKSPSSRRLVPLTDRAVALATRLRDGSCSEWVFSKGKERMCYSNLVRATKKTCENAHVAYRGEHVFRHTFATNCYYKGVDVKILSKLMGHSDIKVTYNIYVSLQGDGFDEMYTALNG